MKNVRYSIRFSLVTLIFLLVILTGGALTYFSYRGNRIATTELAEQIIVQYRNFIAGNVRAYATSAVHAVNFFKKLEESEKLALSDYSRFKVFARSFLEQYPYFANVYFGNEQGHFLLGKRMPDGTLSFQIIYRKDGQVVDRWEHENIKWSKAYPVESVKPVDATYDPRKRPWYLGALETDGVYWTPIYLGFNDNEPTITCSALVGDNSGGAQKGVVGIDIRPAGMSGFLDASNPLTANALVLTDRGEILAIVGSGKSGDFLIRETMDGKQKYRPLNVEDLKESVFEASLLEYNRIRDKTNQDIRNSRNELLSFAVTYEGANYLVGVTRFTPEKSWPVTVAVMVPESSFLGKVTRTAMLTLVLSGGVLLISLVLGYLMATGLSRPIASLGRNMAQIKEFDLSAVEDEHSIIREVWEMKTSFNQMVGGLRSFRKYVPAVLVREMLSAGHEAKVGGVNRELTIFFSDIAGFTGISEAMRPDDLMEALSRYLSEVSSAIAEQGGTVDKYIGDAVMAFWGAPAFVQDHAVQACLAALASQQRIKQLADSGAIPFLNTRMGIHTGMVTVGNVGSEDRLNYTVIGDSVNLASRLEGLNKVYGTCILVSETTLNGTGNRFAARVLDLVVVKGKTKPIRIYELMGLEDEIEENQRQVRDRFTGGFELYLARDFEKALEAFEAVFKIRPDDIPAGMFADRCRMFIKSPPPDDWDGVFVMTHK